MFKQPPDINFQLPSWLVLFSQRYITSHQLSKKMQFVISASRKNIEEKTGGPFAAAIFEIESGALVSLGVNLVASQGSSILHAEMVAIAIAQKKLGTYELGGKSMPSYQLVTSTEPCAMCLGAIPWSGVQHVVTGAHDIDARACGFDEGAKPDDWVGALESRYIKVTADVQRRSARQVLQYYTKSEGVIYSPIES